MIDDDKLGQIFTPRFSDGSRARMRLNDEDLAKTLRGRRWHATVTGKSYRVRGAACPLPNCFCDAVIVGELPQQKPRRRK